MPSFFIFLVVFSFRGTKKEPTKSRLFIIFQFKRDIYQESFIENLYIFASKPSEIFSLY